MSGGMRWVVSLGKLELEAWLGWVVRGLTVRCRKVLLNVRKCRRRRSQKGGVSSERWFRDRPVQGGGPKITQSGERMIDDMIMLDLEGYNRIVSHPQ